MARLTCKGFQWIGQQLSSCDGCGQPYWEHDHLQQLRRGCGPFDSDDDMWVYEPISDDAKQRTRARYAKTT